MFKQIPTFLFLILISAAAVCAQTVEQQIAKIRQLSVETNKRIGTGLKDNVAGLHYATWTIGGKGDGQQWSAVGTMETHAEVWFEGEPEQEGEGGADDITKLVRKIVLTYRGAADLHIRSESTSFDENGELVFALSNDDTASGNGKMIERRFYYAKGKLIRIVTGGKNTDTKFSEDDEVKAKEESEGAKQLQNKFAAIFPN